MSKISRQSTRDGPFGQVVFALLLVQKRWYCARSSIRWLTLREQRMECRPGCGACCTAPSISSPIPGMPDGKPANTPCIQLDEQQRCKIFTSPLRPKVCAGLQAQQIYRRLFAFTTRCVVGNKPFPLPAHAEQIRRVFDDIAQRMDHRVLGVGANL